MTLKFFPKFGSMSDAKLSEVVAKAAQIYARNGKRWCKRHYAMTQDNVTSVPPDDPRAESFCMDGLMGYLRGTRLGLTNADYSALREANPSLGGIIGFNDSCTSVKEVIAALRKTAESLQDLDL